MDDRLQQLLGALGGAVIAAGVAFFAVFASTDSERALVAATGGSFFGHLAAVFGVARVTRKPVE